MYRTISLATDLDPRSTPAWLAAWRVASLAPADLVVVHATKGGADHAWTGMPAPTDLLGRWGVPGKAEHDGWRAPDWRAELRVSERPGEPEALELALRLAAPDLVIVGTRRRSAGSRLLQASLGERLARSSARPALVVPDAVTGFVVRETGALRLRTVLVPVASDQDAPPAVQAAAELLSSLRAGPVAFVVVHVGEELPEVRIPPPHTLSLTLGVSHGSSVATRIADAAADLDVDLVAMVTRGHDSVGDRVLGTHTEQVVRAARCPVLVVPVA
ncbi:MAG: universal stress protein [Myxococcales bacterium]|nr:universal stress protein [Myxococcales bacterium]MCB9671817.1 universal stress protein [Alphaproteobacteria bacterium]